MFQGLGTQWISTQVRLDQLPGVCLSIARVQFADFGKDKVF
jgi:hypothetical protein